MDSVIRRVVAETSSRYASIQSRKRVPFLVFKKLLKSLLAEPAECKNKPPSTHRPFRSRDPIRWPETLTRFRSIQLTDPIGNGDAKSRGKAIGYFDCSLTPRRDVVNGAV